MRDFQRPGRSCVYAANGMVATSHPLASAAALKCLMSGGNAVDAAITAAAVLAVVEPHMTGIGGDCFAMIAKADGTLFGLNGSGRSAKAANLSWYLEQRLTEIPEMSAHSITVPGSIKAWDALLTRFGTKELGFILQPAIQYAREGYMLTPRVAYDWQMLRDKLKANPVAAQTYLDDGQPYQAGRRIVSSHLSNTLEMLAHQGADAFYCGPIARDMVQTIQDHGGLLSEDDFACASVEWVTPVSCAYRHHDIFELPPNGQGITALIMLNILKQFPTINNPLSPQRFHLQMEAAKRAYAARDAFIADPDAMSIPLSQLIDPAYGAKLAQTISLNQAGPVPEIQPPHADTVYLSVVDRDGMACSLINSLYHSFGSGIMTKKTGVMLQSRGCCFSLKENHPNAMGPSKRPLHTIIPAIASKNGRPALCFGVMGGAYQACGHAHVLQNMLDYGMDPQSALDIPRIFWNNSGQLAVEGGFQRDFADRLQLFGHQIVRSVTPHGGGQIIAIDSKTGTLIGGSDPRKDGLAIGY